MSKELIQTPDGLYVQEEDGQVWPLVGGGLTEATEAVKAAWEALTPTINDIMRAWGQFFEEIIEDMRPFIESLAAALSPALKEYANYIEQQRAIEKCPNRRVVHLAKNAKKWRTRKKNLRRALKIIEKEERKP